MNDNLERLLKTLEREILDLKTSRLKPATFRISSRTIQISNYTPGQSIGLQIYEITFLSQQSAPLTFISDRYIEAPAVSDPARYVPRRTANVVVGPYSGGKQKVFITFDSTPNSYNGSVKILSTGSIESIRRLS